MDRVVAAAVDLAVREFGGDGSPVLLLHGAGGTLAELAPLAGHLARDHRVVGMDLRNHGRSGDGPWTWEAVLDDIRAVIDELGLVEPVLVGHSLGGMLAAMYAERRGGIAGAVNLDGFGPGTPDQYDLEPAVATRLLGQLSALGDEMITSAATPSSPDQVQVARQSWLAGALALGLDPGLAEEAFDRPLVAGADGSVARRPVRERLQELKSCLDDLDVLGIYRQSAAAHLVFVAVRDAPSPGLPDELQALLASRRRGVSAQLRDTAQARPNLRTFELDATHGLIYEEPGLIAEQVRQFASGLPARSMQAVGRR